MKAKTAIFAGLLAALTAGCGERDVILTGERSEIREGMAPFVNQVAPVNDAVPRVNAAWSQRNGGPDHKIAHPALAANLTQVLAVNIGEGDSRRARITAEPVVAGGVIYTLDARARVTATATSGAPVWAVDVTPGRDRATDASGGGVSVAGGRVFVTTGFGELTALDAATGRALWTQDLDAPGTSAPTILGDLVYVVARNSTAWALDVNTGRTEWQISGTPSVANFGGGAGVAVNDDIALFPFSSGEVVATFPKGGTRRWSTVVSGERSGQAATVVSDISADPVISGDRAYVGNFGGQLAALDLAKGERIWTAREGAMGPVWPAGNAVFLVNDLNQLVRLNAATGAPVWRVDLPQTEQSNRKRVKAANYGPILAGGRLIVASSLGNLLHYDPTSGALIATTPIAGGAATNPVVAGGTLYVISKEGQLLAFR
uniref:outer membrane protein assembly factor BamB family protein n=1 Tax=Yoonia sp. TaxID=2212373 RepID=UPI0040486473